MNASRYPSVGAFLHDALAQFKREVALLTQQRRLAASAITYGALHHESERAAAALARHGIGPGDRVAIMMGNQPRWLIAACAVFFRGGVIVPLDYKLSPEEQQALLRHAKPRALFIDRSLRARFQEPPDVPLVIESDDMDAPAPPPDQRSGAAFPDTRLIANWETFTASADRTPSLEARERDDVACIVYSSGTGGIAKACMLTHGNYLAQYEALRQLCPLRTGSRYFSILPTNHAIDFMNGFIGPLGGGATIVHQRTLRPEFIRHTLKDQKITHITVVPLILEALARSLEERVEALDLPRRSMLEGLTHLHGTLTARRPSLTIARTLLSAVHNEFGGHLEAIFCGGAFVEPRFAELFHRFGIPVVIGYGLTEACSVATLNDLSPFRADTVGRPVPGVEVKIENPNDEGVGEVFLRGPTIMKGYLDEPELTEASIDRDGFLHTGDFGMLDASGHLKLVGRLKNMVVTAGGKNVYPEDVEHTLLPLDAAELVVMGRCFLWGGSLSEDALIAVARIDGAEDAFCAALQAANQRLPDYKRIRGVMFVDEPFPRTASMKIKRSALAERLRQRSTEDVLALAGPR